MITRSRRPARFLLPAVLLGSVLVAGCDASTEPTAVTVPAEETTSAAPTTTSVAPTTEAPEPETTGAAPSAQAGGSDGPAEPDEDSGSGGAARPATYAEAEKRITAQITAGATLSADVRFSTPGDAVYCLLEGFIACELGSGAVADPEVCGSALGDAVGRIEITDQGALPQCNTDTIREPGAPTVSPPAVVTAGAVTCAVERIGVTCVDESTRTGFFLTPGDYATFG
ncbi:hypothetical protein [Nocardioides sp. YIM 152588]|uniref:hypothetical protein n=1 Tax=Nocardioides sp. YIM 152588 TaxID=3158259 RepID=UPI0032E3D40A